MKKLLIAILAVAVLSHAEGIKHVNDSDFNLNNVTCQAERKTYSDPYAEFIIIHCDDESHFSANVDNLASRNSCNVRKIVGSDTVKYGRYYVKDINIYEFYESITDEYGIDISVQKVYFDCVNIYKKFKSKVVGRVRNSEFKCKSSGCYTFYDDGTKVKYKDK